MNELDIVLGVLIFLVIVSISVTGYIIYKNREPPVPCPPCKPCKQVFSLKQEPLVMLPPEENTNLNLSPGKGKKSCRYDQDTKNVFSTFYKHNCGRTPYVKLK